MGKKRKWTESGLRKAVKESISFLEMLRNLGMKPAGGNYKTFKYYIEKLKIDTSHWLGQGHLKGKTHNWSNKTPLDKILVENSEYRGTGNQIKKKLFRANLFEKKCYNCDRKTWMGKEIPLELEHKNGDNRDNRIENLTILCPNCHAQTETYRGKNKKKA